MACYLKPENILRAISFRDLRLVTELKGYNEIQLLSINMDDIMERILFQLGIDTDYPVTYEVSNHRDMSKKVAVGFRAVGELQCNRAFVNSDLCSVYERIAITSYTDPSLTEELCRLQNSSLDYNSFYGLNDTFFRAHNTIQDYFDAENEQKILKEIRLLEDIRNYIRGDMYNPDGSLKTFGDYRNPQKKICLRQRKRRRN